MLSVQQNKRNCLKMNFLPIELCRQCTSTSRPQEIRQAYNADKLQALRAELDDRREAAANIAEIHKTHVNINKIRKAGEAKQKKREK